MTGNGLVPGRDAGSAGVQRLTDMIGWTGFPGAQWMAFPGASSTCEAAEGRDRWAGLPPVRRRGPTLPKSTVGEARRVKERDRPSRTEGNPTAMGFVTSVPVPTGLEAKRPRFPSSPCHPPGLPDPSRAWAVEGAVKTGRQAGEAREGREDNGRTEYSVAPDKAAPTESWIYTGFSWRAGFG